MDNLIYDIEIEKAICGRGKERLPDIEYCGGWNDQENMGISVLCAFDQATNESRVFTGSNKDQFAALCQERRVIGFNSRKFDDQVLKKVWGIDVPNPFDILVAIWEGDGLKPTFAPRTHGGYGLDACCETNFGVKKTGHGAMAPVDWQRGKIGDVVDYCLHDVYMTNRLLQHIQLCGGILSPKEPGKFISVKLF